MKQKEQNKPSLEVEVTSLKRQLAGSKGRNKQLAEENKKLKEELCKFGEEKVEQLKDALATANEQISIYKAGLNDTKIKLADHKAIIEWYNKKPWYAKIFISKIFV